MKCATRSDLLALLFDPIATDRRGGARGHGTLYDHPAV